MADIVRLTLPPVSEEVRRERLARAVAEFNANHGYSSDAIADVSSYCCDNLDDDGVIALYNEFVAPRVNNILRERLANPTYLRRVRCPR
jgi:hypothetical protein